jgi:hypothetical protein
VKALENAKIGKVTAVVAVMHLYGNAKSSSIDANAKISAKKTKLGSKHPKEAQPPPEDTSERLVVKHKTSRVLLDT